MEELEVGFEEFVTFSKRMLCAEIPATCPEFPPKYTLDACIKCCKEDRCKKKETCQKSSG